MLRVAAGAREQQPQARVDAAQGRRCLAPAMRRQAGAHRTSLAHFMRCHAPMYRPVGVEAESITLCAKQAHRISQPTVFAAWHRKCLGVLQSGKPSCKFYVPEAPAK